MCQENFFGSGDMPPIPRVCYFCYRSALNKDVTSHRCHHTPGGRYTSSITSDGKMGLKTCAVLPLGLTPVLSWSPEREEGIRGFSAAVKEEFLFCLVWGGNLINLWKIRAWASTEGEPWGNCLSRHLSPKRLFWTLELAEETSGRKAAFNLKCGTLAETISGGSYFGGDE